MDVSEKPRILLLNEFGSLNGGERSLLAVLPHLCDRFQFAAAVPCPSPLAQRLQELRVELLPLQIKSSSADNIEVEADQHLRDLVEQAGPDLVHANSLHMSRRLGRIAARLTVPAMGHIRDIVKLSKKAISDVNQLTKLVFVSAATRDSYVSQGIPASLGCVVGNGVDLERFQPRRPTAVIHRELGFRDQTPLLLAVGQLGMRKGLDVLLDVLQIVRAQLPQADLIVAGKRYSEKKEAIEYEQNLLARAASTELRGHVHFLGLRDDVHLLMNEASLLVHAARQEPLGRVLLEASASGLPVVATNVGGTEEIFPAGCGAAVLVPKDHAGLMSQAIVELLGDEPRLLKMSQAARRRARQFFDSGDAALRMARIYQEILHEKPNSCESS